MNNREWTIVSKSCRLRPGAAAPVDVPHGTVFNGRNRHSKAQASVPQLYWEDFTPGRVFEHGPRRLPRDEMIAFAAEFDPQPMHLGEAAAQQSMLGGLAASGWYVCCIMMRMCVDAFVGQSSSMGAPGVEEVRWLLPIRPDAELSLRATVLDARASRSRPDMGLVRFEFELFDARNERVMMLITSLMLGRREQDGPRAVA
jgi:acyl dehydratase